MLSFLVKFVVGFSVLALMFHSYNQATNWHFHKLSDGTLVKHAHPYKKGTSETTPFQKHQHTAKELLLLHLITQLLVFVSVLIAFLRISFSIITTFSLPTRVDLSKLLLQQIRSWRAPPFKTNTIHQLEH